MPDNPFAAEIDRRQSNPFAVELQRRREVTPFGAVPPGTPNTPFGGSTNPRGFEQAVELADPLLQGLTFGLGDELTALVSPASIDEVRDRSERIREEQPGAALAAELGGGLLTASRLGPAGAAAAGATRISKLPALARFGLGGAAAGAVAGFNTGEGGAVPRLETAAEGAAIGAGLGVVLPVVGTAAAAALTPLFNRVQGPMRQAIERVQRALRSDDMTVEQAREELERLGVNATIADVAGENTTGLARAVQSIPGRSRNLGREVLENRQAGQTQRVADSINENLGSGTEFRQTRDDLIASRRTSAAPLYDAAYAREIPNSVELQALLGRPAVRTAYERARTIAANEGQTIPDVLDTSVAPDMRTLDFIKRGLDDVIETSREPLTGKLVGDQARSVASARRELLGLVDEINPDYKAARAVYAGESASIDALNQGRNLGRALNRQGEAFDPEQIFADLERMTDAEKSFFRQGLARGLIDVIQSVPDTADAVKRLIGTEIRRGRLREAFPDSETFTRFMSDLNREARFFQTKGDVLSNSVTQPLAAEQADLLTDAPRGGVMDFLREGRPVGAATRGLAGLVDAARTPSPAVRENVGNLLFAQGRGAQEALNQVGRNVPVPEVVRRAGIAALIEAERQGGSNR